MKNHQRMSVAQDAHVELHGSLVLTGTEVSVNHLPAGAGVPFVRSHKQNEEVYGVLSGKDFTTIDGEKIELQTGDWLRTAPDGKRQISAASDNLIDLIYIQVKAGSLEGYTTIDRVIQ